MVLRWYQARLAARPLLTQAATTAVLFGAGDALAQHAVEKRGLEKHSWARTARMVGYGGRMSNRTRIRISTNDTICSRLWPSSNEMVPNPVETRRFTVQDSDDSSEGSSRSDRIRDYKHGVLLIDDGLSRG